MSETVNLMIESLVGDLKVGKEFIVNLENDLKQLDETVAWVRSDLTRGHLEMGGYGQIQIELELDIENPQPYFTVNYLTETQEEMYSYFSTLKESIDFAYTVDF